MKYIMVCIVIAGPHVRLGLRPTRWAMAACAKNHGRHRAGGILTDRPPLLSNAQHMQCLFGYGLRHVRDLPEDITIVLAQSAFVSFTTPPFDENSKRIVGTALPAICLRAVGEALAFWNRSLAEIGSGCHLGSLRHPRNKVPADESPERAA
jgi:hypothetical protein